MCIEIVRVASVYYIDLVDALELWSATKQNETKKHRNTREKEGNDAAKVYLMHHTLDWIV